MGMELSKDFKHCLRRFAFHYTNGSLGKAVGDAAMFEGIDYRAKLKEEATIVETMYAVYANNITMNKYGHVHDHDYAMRRAAQYIRMVCDDKSYTAVPAFENWELELH